MEIKILDSILHGELKPWKLDTSSIKHFTELIRTAKAVSPTTNAELLKQLTALLADYPTLQKLLVADTNSNSIVLQHLLYSIDLPKGKDPVTHFYSAVITAETLRVYNFFIQQSVNWNDSIDIPFQANRLLNSLKVLTQQTSAELQERGFTAMLDEQSSFIHFTLYFLKHSLIQLYFSVQDSFKDKLQQVTTLEYFYSLDLVEPVSNMLPLHNAVPAIDVSGKKNPKQTKLSFSFKGDKEKLRTVVSQLCLKNDLINDTTNKEEEVFKIFTSKDLKQDAVRINIGCETAQFRYVLDGLKPFFDNFSFATIEKASIFYSKNGTLITAQNYYSSKISNPKTKEEIDSIIKHLQ